MKYDSALPNCILECTAAQSELGAFICRVVCGSISIFWDKKKLQGKAVQGLLSVSDVYAYQNKETKGKKTQSTKPTQLTCRTLHLHTCVHFLNFYLLISPLSDPSSRVEWCTVSIWENAAAELLDCLHAARHEEGVQVFFLSPFRNKQFHLVVSSIFILYSPWVLMLCSEM